MDLQFQKWQACSAMLVCGLMLADIALTNPIILNECDAASQCPTALDSKPGLRCELEKFGSINEACVGHYSFYSNCSCEDRNYRLSTSGEVYWCATDGGWDNNFIDLKCLAPCTTDTDDRVIPRNADGTVSNIIMDGSYVTYECVSGYKSEGDTRAYCKDGAWKGHKNFLCNGNCSIPLNYEPLHPNNTVTFQNGDVVRMKCNEGYIPTAEVTATCIHEHFADVPVCHSEISCSNPNPDDQLVSITPNQTTYTHGSTIVFTCAAGYDLQGNRSSVCVDGKWTSDKNISCSASPCSKSSLGDIRLVVTGLTPEIGEYRHNDTVVLSCITGYELQGSPNATCKFGVWDIDFDPKCKPSRCFNPSLNDSRVEVASNTDDHRHNDTLTFSCMDGYQLQGTFNATCRYGLWDIDIEPICEPVPCAKPNLNESRVEISPNMEEHQHNDTVNFACPLGYELLGNSTATCQFGLWLIDMEPICEPSPCNMLILDDPKVTIKPNTTVYEHNETVKFSCPGGYFLTGPSSTFCHFGSWNTSLEHTCEFMVDDSSIALTVGLSVGIAVCFVILLVIPVAIIAGYMRHDDSHAVDGSNGSSALPSPKDDLPNHSNFDTGVENHGYHSDENIPKGLNSMLETARMFAIATTIQNIGNMKPIPRITTASESNQNHVIAHFGSESMELI